MEMKDLNYKKWVVIGLGGLLGLSHLGMIGIIANKKTESKFPEINIPVNDYTSYQVEAGHEGYRINYKANDPLVMESVKDINRRGGLFGNGGEKTQIVEQYTMDGAEHHGGPVSTRTSWIDPSALGKGEKKISAKTIECIKARGSGEGTGRMVGGSVGATVGSGLTSIPFIGWVLAGAASMIGMDQGADLGGDLAESFSDACVDEYEEDIK